LATEEGKGADSIHRRIASALVGLALGLIRLAILLSWLWA
jgi:hypothetical protein